MYRHVDGTVSGQWCADLWNSDTCCQPFWQYCLDGMDISDWPFAEQDADEKRLWEDPDGPSQVWVRGTAGQWVRDV